MRGGSVSLSTRSDVIFSECVDAFPFRDWCTVNKVYEASGDPVEMVLMAFPTLYWDVKHPLAILVRQKHLLDKVS